MAYVIVFIIHNSFQIFKWKNTKKSDFFKNFRLKTALFKSFINYNFFLLVIFKVFCYNIVIQKKGRFL